MTESNHRFYDEASIYCDSGVATSEQISGCLTKAIKQAEKILGHKTNCKFKINLIINREGEYFGFGYIRISSPEIYWMLLGRNSDGSERFEELPDPNWSPPVIQKEENTKKTWGEIAEDEESKIRPTIRRNLPPLVTIPGYEYDEDQLKHLRDLKDNDEEIPTTGFFEISRGYATEQPTGTLRYRLCARNVPDWIPEIAFKSIFSAYSNSKDFPKINFADSKKGGKIVFVTFNPKSDDALFALLMTKKVSIVNPNNSNEKTTLIFMHAFDMPNNNKKRNNK